MNCGVIGIDFGSEFSVVGVAKKGVINIATNDMSNRRTPSYVAFTSKKRTVGENAVFSHSRNWPNTVYNIKSLIGKPFSHIRHKFIFSTEPLFDQSIGIKVENQNKKLILRPESVAAILLSRLRKSAEAYSGVTVLDATIAVPIHWAISRRMALLDAAKIANVNLIGLISEPAAIALSYGISKSFGDKIEKVLFIDMGFSATSMFFVNFQTGALAVQGFQINEDISAMRYDEEMMNLVMRKTKEKFGIEPKSMKALLRMKKAAIKAKEMLSSNKEVRFFVECLMDDIDVSFNIKREEFELATKEITDYFISKLKNFFEIHKINKNTLSAVEVIGGGIRIPSIKSALEKFLDFKISVTCDADESVAKGATLACAMASPLFKVREFKITDLNNFDIEACWGPPSNDFSSPECVFEEASLLFAAFSPMPSAKLISFVKSTDFQIVLRYSENTNLILPHGATHFIKRFLIRVSKHFKKDDNKKEKNKEGKVSKIPPKIKVKIVLDHSGIPVLKHAYLYEEFENIAESETEKMVENEEENAKNTAENSAENASEKNKTEKENTTEKSSEKAKNIESAKKKQKTSRKTQLDFEEICCGLSSEELTKAIQLEQNMARNDSLLDELANLKNDIESIIIESKPKLNSTLKPFFDNSTLTNFIVEMDKNYEWLYDTETESVEAIPKLRETLAAIRSKLAAGVNRHSEFSQLKKSIENMANFLTQRSQLLNQALAGGDDFVHLEQKELQTVESCLSEATKWIDEVTSERKVQPLWKEIGVKAVDIQGRMDKARTICDAILKKPKPKPKPEISKSTEAEKAKNEAQKTSENGEINENDQKTKKGDQNIDGEMEEN